MKFVLSSVWSQSTTFAVVLCIPSELPLSPSDLCIKSFWYLHNLLLRTSSSSYSSLICKMRYKNKTVHLFCLFWTVLIQKQCTCGCGLHQLVRSPKRTPSFMTSCFRVKPPPGLSSCLFLRGGRSSSSVSEEFGCGWDDRFKWSWGFDTRRLWQTAVPFRQIAPRHQTSCGGSQWEARLWKLTCTDGRRGDQWRKSQHVGGGVAALFQVHKRKDDV